MTLKEARERIELTQAELAERARVTQTTIYDLEVGRNQNPSHANVVRIVRALQNAGLKDVTSDELFPVSVAS